MVVILPLYSTLVRAHLESCIHLEPSAQERHGPVGAGPEKGHKDDLRAGSPLLRGKAEAVRPVQPGEEKAAGRPYSSLPLPEGRPTRKKERGFLQGHLGNQTRDNSFKLKEGRFKLDIRKKFFTMSPWNVLPREAVAAPFVEVLEAR